MSSKAPSYRRRSSSNYAVVTLTDSPTGTRREYSLGVYDSPESKELYYKLLSDWESSNRALPTLIAAPTPGADGITVSEICLQYLVWAEGYYSTNEVLTLKSVLRLIRKYHGSAGAKAIGPNILRELRSKAIGEEYNWSRTYTNSQFGRLKRMYKWAASRELIDPAARDRVLSLENLKRGKTLARETDRVLPVDIELVQATLPHMNRQIKAIVMLQICTGARPNEILMMRPGDINRDQSTWIYTPKTHKMEHSGRDRFIYLGPKAQAVVIPFMDRPADSCMFSPKEAESERLKELSARRVTPMAYGNSPGTNRKPNPKKLPGDQYTRGSYLAAVKKACKQAFPAPTGCKGEELKQWHKDHAWHPYQLRHTAATIIRAQHGLEAAQLILGHSSAVITDAIYAERDQEKIIKIARDVG